MNEDQCDMTSQEQVKMVQVASGGVEMLEIGRVGSVA